MNGWTPSPEFLARRAAIRKVAANAVENGWRWTVGANGWHTPTGLFVDVDMLFRSDDPIAFLAENNAAAYAAIKETIDVSHTIDANFTEVLALPEPLEAYEEGGTS